ncbi:MAG: hypothetical protein J6S71_01590 [Clostridia bacterium]|nr:hypothetical protein [Clostridia bacterium]
MKKLLSTILVLAFVLAALSTLTPLTSAKSATISESEAERLVDAAYDAYYIFNNYEDLFYCEEDAPWPTQKLTRKDDATGRRMDYMEVLDSVLPGDSYEGFLKYADSIFTPEVSVKFTSQSYEYNDFPLFIEENGVRYVALSSIVANPEYNHFMYDKPDNNVIITEGDEKSAKAKVYCDIITFIPITDSSYSLQKDYSEVECLFEKTPNGWRIAESPLASMFMTYGKIEHEPYSGDHENLRFFEYLFFDAMKFYGQIRSSMPYDENEYITPFGEDFGNSRFGEKFARYYLVKENELPGGSYEGLVEESKKYFSDAAAERILTHYASEENMPIFYVQDGKRYACFESKYPGYFGGDSISYLNKGGNWGRPTIDDLVITGDRAIGKVIYHSSYEDHPKEMGYTLYALAVAFVKTERGWVVDDCEELRVQTARTAPNRDYSEYVVKDKSVYEKYGVGLPPHIDFESPATGDSAFDTIAVCLGGMAIVMSVLCLFRRKREY